MKEKRFWMMNEEMKVELEMRDHEGSEEHVKNCKLRKQKQHEKEEQQQEIKKKKKRKKRSTGRPTGRPRIHPKKQLISITMEDLRISWSDQATAAVYRESSGQPERTVCRRQTRRI